MNKMLLKRCSMLQSKVKSKLYNKRVFSTVKDQDPDVTSSPASAAANLDGTSTSAQSFQIHGSASVLEESLDLESLIKSLKNNGFTEHQSRTVIDALNNAISDSMDVITSQAITVDQQEQADKAYKVNFDRLKSEIQLLERNDFVILKQENELLEKEVEDLRQKIQEQLSNLQSNIQIDLKTEKSRFADHESIIQRKIKDLETRMRDEVRETRNEMDDVKNNTIWTIGAISATLASILVGWVKLRG